MFQAVFMCFSPYLDIGRARGGGGLPRDWYLLKQFFTFGSSKMEAFRNFLFDIVIT